MLITFSCKDYENITMFGDIATKLLTLMGHSATIPGALKAEEIPEALSQLKMKIEQCQNPLPNEQENKEENDEVPVSLANRAFPLIKMLEAAIKGKSNVVWDLYSA